MAHGPIALFAPGSTRAFAERIAERLSVPLAALEEREFEDGEHKSRALESVRERDVYVIQSLYGDASHSPDDKLVRLLFLLGALRDAGASRLTAVIPYLCYARKDARTQPRDPVSSRYVAQLFESIGLDRVVVVDVHNAAAYQNAFRTGAEHVTTSALFAAHLAPLVAAEARIAVISPDPGGFKRADRLRAALAQRLQCDVRLGFVEKTRAQGRLSSGRLIGDVAGCAAIIVDDIVASGSTLAAAALACRNQGSTRVLAVASHGLFVSPASEVLASDALDRICVTDSVPPFRLGPGLAAAKVEIVSLAPLLAEVIARLHRGDSLQELF